jgi:hypothetical protein
MSDTKNGRDTPVVQPVWDQDGSPRDDATAPGTSGEVAGITGADWMLYGVVAAVAFGIGIVNALSIAQDAVRRGGFYDLTTPMFWEMSSILVIVLAAPVLFFAVRRMRRESGWLPRIGVASAGIVAFSGLHIAGMVGVRKLAMFLVGGSYDFHFSAGTLIYEFRKDVITCLLMGGALWLIDRRRGPQQLRQDLPNVVWLRDGSTRIRIEPRNIVWVASAGNYVEYRVADNKTHLIRGTLAAEEERLRKFGVVRVHRTRLVNLSRVTGVVGRANGDFELMLDSGETISGSRRYRQAVAFPDAVGRTPAAADAKTTPA